MKRGWEGRVVKGNRNNQTISGVITKSKRHYCDNNEVEIILAEVLFQVEGNNRAIYGYAQDEFHIIKLCPCAPAGLEFA
tara:strand:- start:1195 stop:1431 length:237 start_codon:yes stop_codon:yes gene_type:complete